MSYPRSISDTSVTLIVDGEIYTAGESHPSFEIIKEKVENEDWDGVLNLFNIVDGFANWSDGDFLIDEETGTVMHEGARVPPQLEARIIDLFRKGAKFQTLLNFWTRLHKNPSMRSVTTLYSFLEHENIPIDEDGYFYAYKSVRPDWYSFGADRRTGERVYNAVGEKPRMERNEVNDDPRVGCSYGFHVGSLSYAMTFGGDQESSIKLICKVDPADVVAVPYDCQFQKVRTASYEVVAVYTGPLPSTHITSNRVDEGVFPTRSGNTGQAESDRLYALLEEHEEQLERLETALSAAEDAGMGENYIDGVVNAISEVEGQISDVHAALDELDDGLFEG